MTPHPGEMARLAGTLRQRSGAGADRVGTCRAPTRSDSRGDRRAQGRDRRSSPDPTASCGSTRPGNPGMATSGRGRRAHRGAWRRGWPSSASWTLAASRRACILHGAGPATSPGNEHGETEALTASDLLVESLVRRRPLDVEARVDGSTRDARPRRRRSDDRGRSDAHAAPPRSVICTRAESQTAAVARDPDAGRLAGGQRAPVARRARGGEDRLRAWGGGRRSGGEPDRRVSSPDLHAASSPIPDAPDRPPRRPLPAPAGGRPGPGPGRAA